MPQLRLQLLKQLLIRQRRSQTLIINNDPTLRSELLNVLQIQRSSLHIPRRSRHKQSIHNRLSPLRMNIQFSRPAVPLPNKTLITLNTPNRILMDTMISRPLPLSLRLTIQPPQHPIQQLPPQIRHHLLTRLIHLPTPATTVLSHN